MSYPGHSFVEKMEEGDFEDFRDFERFFPFLNSSNQKQAKNAKDLKPEAMLEVLVKQVPPGADTQKHIQSEVAVQLKKK